MGKSAPSPPPPPDPIKTAAAQAAANKEAAISSHEMSMVDQYTPSGSLTFKKIGVTSEGNPRYKAIQKLSPGQQAILNLQNAASRKYGEIANSQIGNVAGALSKPIDYSSLGPAPVFNDAYRKQQRQNLMSRLQPQFDRRRNALETQLVNQGLVRGSEAFNRSMDEYNRAYNDALIQADLQSTGIAAQQYGLEGSARDRAINEMVQQRQIPLNEMAAMLSGTQVRGPQFVNTPRANVAAAPVAESIYGSANIANQNYQQEMANRNASLQGLYGLLGAGLGFAGATFNPLAGAAMLGGGVQGGWRFSDRRLKRNIKRIGKLANGLAVYVYNYIWSNELEIGLMADEVKLKYPHAVKAIGGYDAVNYIEAMR